MRKLKLFLALALLIVPMIASAGVIVGMNVDVIVQDISQAPADDFHVVGTVQSANAVVPMISQLWVVAMNGSTWAVRGYTVTQQIGNPDLFDFTVDYYLVAGPMLMLNDLLHFGLIMTVDTCNVMVNVDGWFTRNRVRIGIPVPLTGFVVIDPTQPTEDGTVQIRNDSEVPVEVTTLEFCVLSEPVPLEDMFSTGLGLPGTGPSPGMGSTVTNWEPVPLMYAMQLEHMPPSSLVEIPLEDMFSINLQPGQFLLMRGYQREEGPASNSKIPAAFWNQHEEPAQVPPPPPQ